MDYWTAGWQCEQIAGLFRLPPDDIQAAITYIEAHKAEVLAEYQQILARHSRAQPPLRSKKNSRTVTRNCKPGSPRSAPADELRTRMPAIMADHDVEGQVQVLLRLLTAAEWHEVWQELAVRVESFAYLGIPPDSSDAELWRICQAQQILLITGNRNSTGPEALETVMARDNTPTSLPVLTIADPRRVLSSRAYAERVAIRLLEYLLDLENYHGTRRLYLP